MFVVVVGSIVVVGSENVTNINILKILVKSSKGN